MLVPKNLIFSQLRNNAKNTALVSKSLYSSYYALPPRAFFELFRLFMYNLGSAFRNFGIIQEYNERKNKKLINNVLCTDEAKFWVTSSRPSNFGDPLDTKTKVDNWFDENR